MSSCWRPVGGLRDDHPDTLTSKKNLAELQRQLEGTIAIARRSLA